MPVSPLELTTAILSLLSSFEGYTIFTFIFFTIATLPALVLIGLWFVLQLFDGVASLATAQQNMGGVAYFAHIAGFVTGLLITLLLRPRLQPPPPVSYPPFPRHPRAMGPLQW